MGAIEEIYADLETEDVSAEEFREAVEAKVEQMGGLADEETAAMLVAHELSDDEVGSVADIEAGMNEVNFVAKILSVGELRTFERDGEDDEGRVINVEAGDETGAVRLAFWDGEAAAVAEGQLEVGDVVKVAGRPKEGYNGLEVSVDRAEVDEETEIDVDPGGEVRIESLTLGQSDVRLTGLVLGTEAPRSFERDDGSEGRVANLALGDETGRVRVTLWDEQADRATELEPGEAVEIVDGYVREREGELELHVGNRGAVRAVDEPVEYTPEATPIADVALDDRVDLAGVVRSTDPKRTFERDDGSEGQVRNVRLQDESGDIRVALWGDLADLEIAPGDEVLAAEVEIQDGWQDDLEASAGWRSTVTVLEDADVGVEADVETESGGGLDAFTEEAKNDERSNGTETPPDESRPDRTDGDHIEFTGTVVQTGDPAILDDGTETMTVKTSETLRLGEEVTARGELVEGRLHADDVV